MLIPQNNKKKKKKEQLIFTGYDLQAPACLLCCYWKKRGCLATLSVSAIVVNAVSAVEMIKLGIPLS